MTQGSLQKDMKDLVSRGPQWSWMMDGPTSPSRQQPGGRKRGSAPVSRLSAMDGKVGSPRADPLMAVPSQHTTQTSADPHGGPTEEMANCTQDMGLDKEAVQVDLVRDVRRRQLRSAAWVWRLVLGGVERLAHPCWRLLAGVLGSGSHSRLEFGTN